MAPLLAISVQCATPLLDPVRHTSDLRNILTKQLKHLAGFVELTVASHAVFETPRDRISRDVGHQAGPHKILTGQVVGADAGPDTLAWTCFAVERMGKEPCRRICPC